MEKKMENEMETRSIREKGFPKLGVPFYHFGAPCNKDHSILGFIGVPLVWETTI